MRVQTIVQSVAFACVTLSGLLPSITLAVFDANPSQPGPVALASLTVPQNRLPSGCALKVIEPARQQVIGTLPGGGQRVSFIPQTPSMQPGAVTANPWIGKDRHVLAEIHERMQRGKAGMRLPDGPPLTPGEESALRAQWANGVEEGYAATYAQAGARDLGVWALRFSAAPETKLELPGDRSDGPATVRFEFGALRFVLYGDGHRCSQAIEAHLRLP